MREIKFRYYNAASKSMHPNIYYAIDLDGNFLMSMPLTEGKYPETDRRFTITELHKGDALMQYTGLKDKNGVEIYEGDILEVLEIDADFNTAGTHTTAVEYRNGQWNGSPWTIFAPSFSTTKVIGNIYENKELLNAS